MTHDIWNPWTGCHKCSPGCQNCFMYALNKQYDPNLDSSIVRKTNNFEYPLKKDKNKEYKVKPGEHIRICMSSDFFVEEADEWRMEAWDIIRKRSDVVFFILTKRPERVKDNLPSWWDNGLENVFFNVTTENQECADKRIPILFDLPFKHKGIMVAPFIGGVNIEKYLKKNIIEQVICDGENYDWPRPLHYEWVKTLSDQCKKHNVRFAFLSTGNYFIKDGKTYIINDKNIQTKQAFKSGLQFDPGPIKFNLFDEYGNPLPDDIYVPYFRERCNTCGSRMICNGCTNCGKCEKKK